MALRAATTSPSALVDSRTRNSFLSLSRCVASAFIIADTKECRHLRRQCRISERDSVVERLCVSLEARRDSARLLQRVRGLVPRRDIWVHPRHLVFIRVFALLVLLDAQAD